MSNPFKQGSAVLFGALLLVVTALASAYATDPLIEFYHAGSDHYFVSADPLEIDAIDGGIFAGWTRTGHSWPVIRSSDPTLAGATPVCRFYGLPSAGLDSHFYSAFPAECADVEAKFPGQWELESDNVFQVYLSDPNTGACPTGTQPVYRTWNNRRDSNHRYTTDAAVQASMVAKGYIAEGYGNPPVAMCAPTASTTAAPPPPAKPFTCSASASATTPAVGTPIQISSSCNAPVATYRWTNYSGTDPNPIVTSPTAEKVTYTLSAKSTSGQLATASVTLDWRAGASGETPTCQLSVSPTSTPTVDTFIVVFAQCSAPQPYEYSGCGGGVHGTGSCHVVSSTPGRVTYKVRATNSAGTGPWASATVTWQP